MPGLVIYNLIFILLFIVSTPFFLYKMIRFGKYRAGILQRFGLYSVQLKKELADKNSIWVHAVSVGEILSILPVIEELKNEYSSYKLVVSTTTLTGNRIAREKLQNDIAVIYYPLDFFCSVSRAFKTINPAMIVLTETELWPNFLSRAHGKKIPVALVNARISEKSYKGYYLFRWFLRPLLKRLDVFAVQTQEDAERLKKLGAKPGRVKVVGNIKYAASVVSGIDEVQIQRLYEVFGYTGNDQIIVCGSTHEGEENVLLDIWQKLKSSFPMLRMIIAPRHPERWKKVEELIRRKGVSCMKRTILTDNGAASPDVVLLDTMGELASIYSIATIVFIGKSLFHYGGQNILEPASLAKPVIFGPHMENFNQISKQFLSAGAAVQVSDEVELEHVMVKLLEHPDECRNIGVKAREIVMSNQGAARKTFSLVKEVLRTA